jgi:hypothetical protein
VTIQAGEPTHSRGVFSQIRKNSFPTIQSDKKKSAVNPEIPTERQRHELSKQTYRSSGSREHKRLASKRMLPRKSGCSIEVVDTFQHRIITL